MLTEEELLRQLNELRNQDEIQDRDGEAVCLIAQFLDQLGKHTLAEALRNVSFPARASRPALRLVE
jgi:hypothetical protein